MPQKPTSKLFRVEINRSLPHQVLQPVPDSMGPAHSQVNTAVRTASFTEAQSHHVPPDHHASFQDLEARLSEQINYTEPTLMPYNHRIPQVERDPQAPLNPTTESWLHAGAPKIQVLRLRALSKCSLNSGRWSLVKIVCVCA